jgi:hypothetical protein
VENGRHVRFLKFEFDPSCILSIVASQKKSRLMLDSLKGEEHRDGGTSLALDDDRT